MPQWLKNCCNKKDMNILMAVGENKRLHLKISCYLISNNYTKYLPYNVTYYEPEKPKVVQPALKKSLRTFN